MAMPLSNGRSESATAPRARPAQARRCARGRRTQAPRRSARLAPPQARGDHAAHTRPCRAANARGGPGVPGALGGERRPVLDRLLLRRLAPRAGVRHPDRLRAPRDGEAAVVAAHDGLAPPQTDRVARGTRPAPLTMSPAPM